MDAAKAQILFDIALLILGAAVIGLPVFALLRRRDPEIGWSHHGNVWTPFDRLDLLTAGILFSYFFASAALPALMSEQIEAATAKATEKGGSAMSTPVLLIANAVFTIALGAGVFCYASVLRRRDPVQLFGLDRLKPLPILVWTAGGVFLGFVVVFCGAVVWKLLFEAQWGEEGDLQEVVQHMMNSKDPLVRGLLVFTAVIVAPLVEETLFRGFLYPVFKRYTDRFFAAVVTAMLFAVVHGNVPGMLPLFLLALVLTAAYELSGCLWVPIAIHAAFNAIQSAFMILLGDGG